MSESTLTLSKVKEEMKKKSVVKFTAPWCGPCQAISTSLHKLCKERSFSLLEVDIDDYPEIAEKFRVSAVPTMYISTHGRNIVVRGADMGSVESAMDELASQFGTVTIIDGDIPMM